MLELVIFLLTLGLVWLVWSGVFTPLMFGFAAFSVLVILWLAARMESVDSEHYRPHLGLRSLPYALWLIKEIFLSSVAVARAVWAPRLRLKPGFGWVEASQASDEARVYYANSITLTPGTVSCDVEDKRILVHALDESGLASLKEGGMDRKVTRGFE